jgi:hypothetical protein
MIWHNQHQASDQIMENCMF